MLILPKNMCYQVEPLENMTYSNKVIKHITVDTTIHTGFLLLLVKGSARCDANAPRVSEVMLRKLYEPRK